MKPAEKALDIAVVGLGQAGGNLAAELHRRGYPVLALNTASTDLSTFSQDDLEIPAEQCVYIGIDGHDGAGADAGYGRECIDAHAEAIRERVAQHAEGCDLVLLTAGLGGGTGSAIADLIRVLDPLSLPLLAMATLPSEHESGIAKVNAVRSVNALVKENLLGWIFVDNSRVGQANGDIALDRYFPEINKQICGPLDTFNGLNSRTDFTPIRALDGEDFRTLLLSGGVLNIAHTSVPKLSVDSVMQAVRDSVQYSTIMPEGFSLEKMSYLGLVLEGPSEALEQMSFAAFEQVSEQLKEETGGAGVYLGVYRGPDDAETRLRLICSTPSLPTGIQEMVSSAKREGGQLREKLQQTLTGLDLGEIEEYELVRTSPGTRRRVESSAGTRPSVIPQRARPSRAPAKPISDSIRPGSTAPMPSIAPPSDATDNGREAYDRLVKTYQEATSDDERSEIGTRLNSDSKSDNSLVRYYAVRAMSKLDTSAFEDALKTATDDEDATVRAVATKALQAPPGQ